MTTKERAVDLISRMPKEATLDDIISELFVLMQIDEGLRELDNGQGLDQQEVEKRLSARGIDNV